MIVFDLLCGGGHRFEAWFRSGESFDEQAAAGVLACPFCRDSHVTKAPMAPMVARSTGGRADRSATSGAPCGAARGGAGTEVAVRPPAGAPVAQDGATSEAVIQTLARLRETIETTCEDVGPRFADEARRIHFGEAEERGIYGEASAKEAAALREDGIVCQVLPWWQRRND